MRLLAATQRRDMTPDIRDRVLPASGREPTDLLPPGELLRVGELPSLGPTAGDLLEGRYRIERLLSHGAMSSVYLAHHHRLGRRVALKVIRQMDVLSDEASRRFENEAQAA